MTKEELLELYKKLKTQKALREYLHISEGALSKLLAINGICKNNTKRIRAAANFIKKAKQIHGDKFDYSETKYERSCLKVKIKCNRCNQYFLQTPNSHLTGNGCPYCKNELNGIKQMKSQEQFIKEATEIFSELYDYSWVEYKGAHHKVKILCNKCKRFFYKSPDKHISTKQGCPYCSKTASRGEKEVANWLLKNNIKFIQQKRFKDCKDIRTLPFDFYLPDYDVCIEYQGRQHYIKDKHSKFLKNITDLAYIKQHDTLKKQYCMKKGIKLIEIIFDKNTNQQLELYLLPILNNTLNKKGVMNEKKH